VFGYKITPRALLLSFGRTRVALHDVQRGVLDDHVIHADPRHDHLLVTFLLLGLPGSSLLSLFLVSIAKYDSNNKIQIPGYFVDLFTLMDSPRTDYQLGLIGFKMLSNGITQ
jgi:hypothetical protein